MQKLDEALFEHVVQWAAAHTGEASVLASRHAFELTTGPIEQGDPDFESRMGHFFEHWLCEGAPGPSLLEQYANEIPLPTDALRQLAGWQRSHRALLEFEDFRDGYGLVRDLLLGGRYRFLPGPRDRELARGDRFDGRLIAGPSQIWLSPGRVYHPRAAFAALDKLLLDPAARALPARALLDGLMRMRSRFMRFESIKPEHVYSADGLTDAAFAAPWASPARRRHS
jgi:hypothetical protein